MKVLPIIGRRELANLPEMGFQDVEVKLDTGAYTSSISCTSIVRTGDKVKCRFFNPKDSHYTDTEFEFDIIKELKVKSSNGTIEHRFMIITTIELLGEVYSIRLTLTDRVDMKYPVLIGRKFISGKFIVDVRVKNQANTKQEK